MAAGFKTQMGFLAFAEKQGFGSISYSRYNALERGVVDLTATDARVICGALKVSADLLLFGGCLGADMRELSAQEMAVVLRLARGLVELRSDEIRGLDQG